MMQTAAQAEFGWGAVAISSSLKNAKALLAG